MFWRMTAQRLLVERRAVDAVPALIRLVDEHTVDALGLNSPALHALWTLHGLGAIRDGAPADAAARRALHHPAAAVRRAALQMLPRDSRLSGAIFAAGILPERASPTRVDYTVGTSILQVADAHVRLEALLVLSELPPSPRHARAIADVILSADNARDPWMPDAAAMAGARQGPGFVAELLARRMPTDSATLAGVRRSVQKLARHHAITMDAATVISFVELAPKVPPVVATGIVAGITQGWAEEKPPTLSDAQRAALRTAARGADGPLKEAFTRLGTRWAMPDLFENP
jgi:hypothetical protein